LQITKAEQQLGLSRKKVSVSAYRAFDQDVLLKRWMFWTQPYPLGIADIDRRDMINIDEARIITDTGNRHFGKCTLAERARIVGHYKGEGRLLVTAILGREDGEKWLRIEDCSGTTLVLFVEFIQQILEDLGPGIEGDRHCLMMDNLNVHHHLLITQMVHEVGHRIIYRAPYWPKDGPIEYFFNSFEINLRNTFFKWTNAHEMEVKILEFFIGVVNFVAYFHHVGFR
jgi:hypothetical protein